MAKRLVVTGEVDGKSVVVSDAEIDPLTFTQMPGNAIHRLWGSDSPVTLPYDGDPLTAERFFPPPGGYRFVCITYPPRATAEQATVVDPEMLAREMAEKLPGTTEDAYRPNPGDPVGMHGTKTIDFAVVLSGRFLLSLPTESVELRRGDCVVQVGAVHEWSNPGDETAVMAVVLVGVDRS